MLQVVCERWCRLFIQGVSGRKVWSIKRARMQLEKIIGFGCEWAPIDGLLAGFLEDPADGRTAMAAAFGASLEMAREGVVELRQDSAFNPLYLRRKGRKRMSFVTQRQRKLEALLFAATEPLDIRTLRAYLDEDEESGEQIAEDLQLLQQVYQERGVHLNNVAGKWAFRTAIDLRDLLERHKVVPRKLSRAALETLAIIAYHQPATRAEIEEIRGVTTSKGTLDVLLETSWIRPRGRRMTPGRNLLPMVQVMHFWTISVLIRSRNYPDLPS